MIKIRSRLLIILILKGRIDRERWRWDKCEKISIRSEGRLVKLLICLKKKKLVEKIL